MSNEPEAVKTEGTDTMAIATTLRKDTRLTKLRLGLALVLAVTLLLATQAVAFAQERDECPEEPPRREAPCGNSMEEDPADNGNSIQKGDDNGNSIEEVEDPFPGVVVAPIEFDLKSAQPTPPPASVITSRP